MKHNTDTLDNLYKTAEKITTDHKSSSRERGRSNNKAMLSVVKAIAADVVEIKENTGKSANDIASMFIKKGKALYTLSEKNNNKVFYDDKTLVILISQSGETADTIAALKLSKAKGVKLEGKSGISNFTHEMNSRTMLGTRHP